VKRFLRLLLVISVLYGTGLHWTALQVYAWTTMAAAGQKDPCKVCRLVAKGSSADQTESVIPSGPALDLAVSVVSLPDAVLPASRPSVSPSTPFSSLSTPPPVPPPPADLPA
jgi:hypothetical protein